MSQTAYRLPPRAVPSTLGKCHPPRRFARSLATIVALLLGLTAAAAQAGQPAPGGATPYSLPWHLRPVAPASVLRSDSVVAFYEDSAGQRGTTFVTTLLGSYKVTPHLAPLVRLALVADSPPSGQGAVSFVNPAVGLTYGLKAGPFRLGLFLGLTIPVGMGGGDHPDPRVAKTNKVAKAARSGMDNALFAVNDFTVFPGVDLALVTRYVTLQVEATVLELIRVRGKAIQPDELKTNFTTGVHLGIFLIPQLSVAGELRYQRWLTTPSFVAADPTGAERDTLTVSGGLRAHFRIAPKTWFRPGLAYIRGLDNPLARQQYNMIQIDLPFVF